MSIEEYQVLQRDGDDCARVVVEGGETLTLPVGGPYTVEGAREVYVGDLWLLAGQSNMEGVGDLDGVEAPSPSVHAFEMRERWSVAQEPLHWLTESLQPVHHHLLGRAPVPDSPAQRDPGRTKGAGVGLSFGKEYARQTGTPVGLIVSAHGGSSLDQWSPQHRALGGRSLYGAALHRVRAVGGKIAGILWYQGESETSEDGARAYEERMRALVAAFRADLERPDLPFYFVQIGRVVGDHTHGWDWSIAGWNGVREAQRRLAATLPHSALVTAIDLDLDDLIHIGTPGLTRLGRRLAAVAQGHPAPDLASARISGPQVRVTVRGLRGPLRAAARPSGFSLRDRAGRELQMIYKVTLEGDTAVLHLTFDAASAEARLPHGTVLWYGWGTDPYCNITDSADAAVPAFGPVPLQADP